MWESGRGLLKRVLLCHVYTLLCCETSVTRKGKDYGVRWGLWFSGRRSFVLWPWKGITSMQVAFGSWLDQPTIRTMVLSVGSDRDALEGGFRRELSRIYRNIWNVKLASALEQDDHEVVSGSGQLCLDGKGLSSLPRARSVRSVRRWLLTGAVICHPRNDVHS